ncbi:MAG: S8 family serine peptidase [Patescibacteria group bacterium]
MSKKITKIIAFTLCSTAMLFSAHIVFATHSNFDLVNLSERVSGIADAYFKISLEQAWEKINASPRTLTTIVIGILDSGTDATHPEFAGVRSGTTPPDAKIDRDPDGHGTEVAGIIGANNVSFPISTNYQFPQMNGILSGAHNLDYRLEIRKTTNLATLFNAIGQINNLVASGAKIVNLSLSQFAFRPDIFVTNLFFTLPFQANPDTLFIVAAGNDTRDASLNTPANSGNLPNVITVGATKLDDSRVPISNFGSAVGIAAPGDQVYAPKPFIPPLDPTDYDPNFTDTSASAPMVTGVAGLIKAIRPELTPSQIKQILISTADPIVTDQPIGPRLNALNAVCHPLVLNCVPPVATAPIWPMFQKNAQHTGFSDVSGPPFATSTDVKIKWQKSLGAGAQSFSPLIASDGTVYVATASHLFAFEGETGNQKWRTNVPGSTYAGAIGPDGTLYVCSSSSIQGTLSAFEPQNGQKKWDFIIGGPSPCTDPVIDNNGTVYTAVPPPIFGQIAVVIAINSDGTEKWRYEELNITATSPALSNDESQVYVALSNRLIAFSALDGNILWTQNGNFTLSMAPVVDFQDRVFITSIISLQDTGFVHAFSKTGTAIWTSQSIGSVQGSPALNSQNQIVVASRDKLFIIDPADGEILSSVPLSPGQAQNSHPVIDKDATVYITFDSGEIPQLGVVAVDSNAIRWFFPTFKRVFSAPALSATGTLYVIAEDTLFALGE